MANTQAMCTSFLQELMQGLQDFTTSTGNSFKAALYEATATYNASTTAYAVTNEVSGTNYTAGGVAVTNGTSPQSTNASATAGVAYWTPSASITYTNVTLTTAFDAVLIYNNTNSNRSVAVLAFGGDKTSTNGDFTIVFPAATSAAAIIRIA